jgi:hypothetical protein
LMPNDPSRWSNQDYSRTSQVGQSSLGLPSNIHIIPSSIQR